MPPPPPDLSEAAPRRPQLGAREQLAFIPFSKAQPREEQPPDYIHTQQPVLIRKKKKWKQPMEEMQLRATARDGGAQEEHLVRQVKSKSKIRSTVEDKRKYQEPKRRKKFHANKDDSGSSVMQSSQRVLSPAAARFSPVVRISPATTFSPVVWSPAARFSPAVRSSPIVKSLGVNVVRSSIQRPTRSRK